MKYGEKINKCDEDFLKQKAYYNNKLTETILMAVIYGMPFVIKAWKLVRDSMPLFSCVVIVSAIELAIIGLLIPELIEKKSKDYFEDGDEKIFIKKE